MENSAHPLQMENVQLLNEYANTLNDYAKIVMTVGAAVATLGSVYGGALKLVKHVQLCPRRKLHDPCKDTILTFWGEVLDPEGTGIVTLKSFNENLKVSEVVDENAMKDYIKLRMSNETQGSPLNKKTYLSVLEPLSRLQPNILGQAMNLIVIGNPGVGKSTVLNSLVATTCSDASCPFDSGISGGTGLTTEFKRWTDPKKRLTTFIDTPGLADCTARKKAATQIRDAMKLTGYYKILFVFSLRNGRVVAEDKATMKIVLDAVPTIQHYGVLVNQLEEEELELFHDSKETQVHAHLMAGIKPKTKYILAQKKEDCCKGKQNTLLPRRHGKKIENFLRRTPCNFIEKNDVKSLGFTSYDDVVSELVELRRQLDEKQGVMQQEIDTLKLELKRQEEANSQLEAMNAHLNDSGPSDGSDDLGDL